MEGKVMKARKTRQLVLDSALAIISEEGYDKATMRAIAKRAELSLGAAYYHFPTKEHIIQGFYELTLERFHQEACQMLSENMKLLPKLRGILQAQFRAAAPFHQLSGPLFRAASVRGSALSPFSEASKPLRDRVINLYDKVLEECRIELPDPLRAQMPLVLWLFHMGLIMYWVHDTSPRQRRTRQLIDDVAPLISHFINLARVPLFKPVWKTGLKLLTYLPFPVDNLAQVSDLQEAKP